MENKTLKYYIFTLVAVIMLSIFYFLFFNDKNKVELNNEIINEVVDQKLTSQEAFVIAVVEAKKWHADSVVSKFETLALSTSENGRSNDWNFLFVSPSSRGKGYQIIIKNKKFTDATEVPYVGEGGELPEKTITAEEAIGKLRQIAGYENEKVLSVEMMYGPDGKEWYWAVKTSRGVISINAKK